MVFYYKGFICINIMNSFFIKIGRIEAETNIIFKIHFDFHYKL